MKTAMQARLKAIQAPVAKFALGISTLAATAANAAPMDVTGVTSAITDQSTNVQTIAIAVLGVLALIAGISYLRRVIK